MALFRKVHMTFWDDPDVLEWTVEEKLFYLYLLTNPRTSLCGIYEFNVKKAVFETGITIKKIQDLLGIFQDRDRIYYSEDTREIAIKNWQRHNKSSSPKASACIEKEYNTVKNTVLIEYVTGKNTVLNRDRVEKTKTKTKSRVEKTKSREEAVADSDKKKYADDVYMTDNEYKKLCEKYGTDKINLMIEKLSAYQGSKGVNYKSAYKTIISWILREAPKSETDAPEISDPFGNGKC